MGRSRVLSFISSFKGSRDNSASPTDLKSSPKGSPAHLKKSSTTDAFQEPHAPFAQRPLTPTSREASPSRQALRNSPPSSTRRTRDRSSSRPQSMIQAYQPSLMEVNEDTIPELQPIFTFLNSHVNKLYHEGYFLKLDDQNSQGRPNPDRTWTECFAQLVGTVLSLWDAAELDAAGDDGEVLPKFINLTDASIKMIESLPTRSKDEQPLQNILSISTAGRNRYLLHFNSKESLLQWTAGIRLAIFEHTSLQEAYTGALIAGKGKSLNNINVIMERMRLKNEAWVRVRFGAGVPWRRCWCVITPPDEKEYQKLQKELKKRSPYDRSHIPPLKGDIKFYDTKKEGKKQKKARPIATITDAHSAYALYPQSKSLIDASTLLKIEGSITIHSDPPSSTEGFVFVMPETHPAVSGFEMLLRFLFPTWDTFGLYGRPGRLVASVLDPRSLMFAMPKTIGRYGYLDLLDVMGLLQADGSGTWSEKGWRKNLKELSGQRMNQYDEGIENMQNRSDSRRSNRLSFGTGQNGNGQARPKVGFAAHGAPVPAANGTALPKPGFTHHGRNSSDPQPVGALHDNAGTVMNMPHINNSTGHGLYAAAQVDEAHYDRPSPPTDTSSSDDELKAAPIHDFEGMRRMETPEPVSQPPAFNHEPQSRPGPKAYHSSELRRANSRLSVTTLSHLAKAGGVTLPEDGPTNGTPRGNGEQPAEQRQLVHSNTGHVGVFANQNRSREALIQPENAGPPGARNPQPMPSHQRPPNGPPPHRGEYRGTDVGSGPMPHGQRPPPELQRPYAGHYRPSTPPSRGYSPGPGNQQTGTPRHGPQGRSGLHNEVTSLQTSPSRKPVPQRPEIGQAPDNMAPQSAASSSAGSFQSSIVDRAILDQVRHRTGGSPTPGQHGYQRQDSFRSGTSSHYSGTGPRNTPQMAAGGFATQDRRQQPIPRPDMYRKDSSKSSHYSDKDSTTTPDYASTVSSGTSKSVERPRAGVLKTVGGGDGLPMPPGPRADEYDLPTIDFGPTVDYNMQRGKHGAASPDPDHQRLPFAHVRKKSPAGHPGHGRQESSDTIRRSVVWQPGAAIVGSGSSAGQSVSVEEYVQQRAVAASTPVISHARSPSGNTLGPGRSVTPTPSMTRTASGDLMNNRHSRSSSADLLSRPGSRGANATLAGSAGEASSNLSARELEHVARMTGSPLINMAGGSGRQGQQQQGPGLVGAIEAREREKQQIKQGVNSQAVQNAINQRQQQMYQQQQHQHQQQNMNMGMGMGPQGSMFHPNMGMGQGPPPWYSSAMQQQQPTWRQDPSQQGLGYSPGTPPMMTPPMSGGYGQQQQGAWHQKPPPRPSPSGRQSPGYFDARGPGSPQGGHYGGSPQGQHQGRGRGPGPGPIYQGQAF